MIPKGYGGQIKLNALLLPTEFPAEFIPVLNSCKVLRRTICREVEAGCPKYWESEHQSSLIAARLGWTKIHVLPTVQVI
jgi:hypothetical protein